MRENRTYGSEGGEGINPPRPYQVTPVNVVPIGRILQLGDPCRGLGTACIQHLGGDQISAHSDR